MRAVGTHDVLLSADTSPTCDHAAANPRHAPGQRHDPASHWARRGRRDPSGRPASTGAHGSAMAGDAGHEARGSGRGPQPAARGPLLRALSERRRREGGDVCCYPQMALEKDAALPSAIDGDQPRTLPGDEGDDHHRVEAEPAEVCVTGPLGRDHVSPSSSRTSSLGSQSGQAAATTAPHPAVRAGHGRCHARPLDARPTGLPTRRRADRHPQQVDRAVVGHRRNRTAVISWTVWRTSRRGSDGGDTTGGAQLGRGELLTGPGGRVE